jgi:phosphoribosylamine--glycine ligase
VNVLLLGSGGREHAFAHFISKSKNLSKLFIAPGNAGTQLVGENVSLNPLDFQAVWSFIIDNHIELVVPGNEDPLVAGVTDFIEAQNSQFETSVLVAGPSKYASQLEGSKSFSKDLMREAGIPTARFKTINSHNFQEGIQFLDELEAPYVLKADGLAAGKGVLITKDKNEAQTILSDMIKGEMFGSASSTVVIEEFLKGIEISVFVVSDGNNYQILGSAKDYKRIFEGDQGPNTGGMGAISPVPFADDAFMNKVKSQIIEPTLQTLQNRGYDYRGFLFLGLMNDNGDPKVIEYNVRMGDPETEAIFPRLKTDMLELLQGIGKRDISNVDFALDERTAATVFLVSEGYPGAIVKGREISGLDNLDESIFIFHAGTSVNNGKVVTNGGRVIAVTSLAENMELAIAKSMLKSEEIDFQGKFYRKDIGQDLISLQK